MVSTHTACQPLAAAPIRRLHLVDLENLAGGPRAGAVTVASTVGAYLAAAPVGDTDQVVIAMNANNPTMAYAAADSWPYGGRTLKVAHGHDGADHALLDAFEFSKIVERFGEVVIGSGDHAFSDLIGRLLAVGIPVVVVTREEALSAAVRRLAPGVRYIPAPDVVETDGPRTRPVIRTPKARGRETGRQITETEPFERLCHHRRGPARRRGRPN